MFYKIQDILRSRNHSAVKSEIGKQNADRNFLQNTWVKNLIILICIIADMATLYNIFELQMTQQQILTIIITVVIAGALNIAPVLLAVCLNDKEDTSRLKNVQMTAFAGVFILLFVSTAILRWTSREDLFASESGLMISGAADIEGNKNVSEGYIEVGMQNAGPQGSDARSAGLQNAGLQSGNAGNTGPQIMAAGPKETTMAQNACALILLLEPLATSAVCFGLSYEKDPHRKKRQFLRLQNVRLRQERDGYQVQITELEQELKECNLAEYDKEQYDIMRKQIELYRQYFKIHARRRLAEKDGTANAATLLLEENKLVQAIGGMKL